MAEDVPDEDPPFDVLFGGVYFVEHAFEDFDSPVLILKSKPKSHCKLFALAFIPRVELMCIKSANCRHTDCDRPISKESSSSNSGEERRTGSVEACGGI